jgi:peptidyl-dipeptidase Dcp
MLAPWEGPFGGVPPFDKVVVEEFVDLFTTSIRGTLAAYDAIAQNATATQPTFENTIVAMESAGAALERLSALYGVHANNLNVGPMNAVEGAVSPMLAEFGDKIIHNAELFRSVKHVYDSVFAADGSLTDAASQFSDEQRRLLQERYREFVRNGANLGDVDKARLTEINQRLAVLFTNFGQNILESEKGIIVVDTLAELEGVPESLVKNFADAAAKRDKAGSFVIQNTRSSVEPLLHYAKNRALRQQVWSAFVNRGAEEGANNNYSVIVEILALRKERAGLLGYASHAAWRIETEMAKTPERALELLMNVWPAATSAVAQEVKDMMEFAAPDGVSTIEPWDYRFYSEKVRLARYNLDFNEVVPYLDAEKLREGMFWAAGELHDLDFKLVPAGAVPVFHEEVRVWEVVNKPDGSHVGLFYFDPFCRDGKRSGAWMTGYRNQSLRTTQAPIISNNSNFVKSSPLLISWDDAVTMFHEFGHGLHGLLSKVTYEPQSGTNVARDFVEFPSQLNEHWLETTQMLERFATHHETGKPMPQELLKKIKAASNFNQGFKTVEYLSCALLDLRLHMGGEASNLVGGAVDAFERDALAAIGMPSSISMRHRLAHFAHIFSTDSYSAGYYSYMWADTLVADAAEAFQQAPGGFFDKDLAKKYRTCVLQVGNSVDPAVSFANFRGRPVDASALMRKRGFL